MCEWGSWEDLVLAKDFLELFQDVVLRGEGGFREGLESVREEQQESLCDERDAEGQNNFKAISTLCDEWEEAALKAQPSLPREHDLRLPEQRATVSCHGLL